ncbi:MAG: T9SS type A sorting domain-containing protein [Bacteroidetes bacterium]|nr:T9SS type A sorting domain-containing protein [Bacteroidota bacterium]
MKQLYSFIPAVIFSVGLVAFISTQSPRQAPPIVGGEKTQTLSEGNDADDGLLQYELQRLRDPETGKIPSNIRRLELEYAATLPGYVSPSSKGVQNLSSLNWQSRGPWNVGGRTRAFAIDVTNSQKLLAGSTSGGMWSSANGGTSWSQNWSAVHQSVSCIAQDTRAGKTNTWYIGTGEGYGQSAGASGAYYLGNGMYKSTDGGTTWNSLPSTVSGTPQSFDNVWDLIWNVATNPADTSANGTVYAAVYNAVYKSINGGTSWTLARGTGISAPYSYFTDVAVSDSGVIYATLSSDGGAQKGIWRSPDGVTWTSITPVGFPTTYGRIKIGISPSDGNQVYFWAGTTTGFGTADTNFLGQVEWNSLWKYHYNSTSPKWYDLSANLPTTGGPHDKQHVQGGYDMLVKFHPTDTAVVFLGGTNLYRSDDGFFSPDSTHFIGGYKKGSSIPLTIDTYLNHHPDQHEVVFDNTNNSMYSSNDGGIYKTTNFMADTVAWTKLNNGYLTSMFYTVALDHATPNDSTIIGGLQDNNSWFVNSQNPQSPWVSEFFGDGSYCAIDNGKNNYYFSIQNGKMQKMQLDAAGNVLARRRIDPIGGKGYQFINPYTLDPNNNNRMYLAGGKNLWRNDSLNFIPLNGNWDSISQGWLMFPDTVPTANAKITALAVSKNPANILYYGTSNKRVYRIDNANVGTPIATDITGTVSPNLFPAGNVSCIAIDPNDAGNVIVAFSNYSVYSLFYSTNADSTVPTWSKVGGNLEPGNGTGPSVRWATILPVSDGTVYLVATSTGVYATDTLTGTSTVWALQGATTIGNSICDMIDTRTSDGLVAVATHSRGVFTTNITSINDVVTSTGFPIANFGFQVYPNPNSGVFNVQMSGLENVQMKGIEVFNSHGEKVFESAHPHIRTSSHLQIDLSSQPSGVYFCVMKAGEATQTRKLLIIK